MRPGLLALTAAYILYLFCVQLEFISAYVMLLIGIYVFWATLCVYSLRKNAASNAWKYRFSFLALALFIRCAFFFSEPKVISSDVYRYLYDGKMSVHQINPYRYKPADDAISFLRYTDVSQRITDPLYANMHHTQFRTIYPPLSQFVFKVAYLAGRGDFWPLRIFYLLLEGLFFFSLLRFISRSTNHLDQAAVNNRDFMTVFWAFNPYLIFETYFAMHIDFVSMFFLWLAFLFFDRRRYTVFTLFLAAAVLSKVVALITVPVFLFFYFRRGAASEAPVYGIVRYLVLALIFAAVIIAAYLPFYEKDLNLFESLTVFAEFWRFNAFTHSLLAALFSQPYLNMAKLAILAVVFVSLWRMDADIVTSIKAAVLSLLFLAPVYYPWYNVSLLPFFFVRPSPADFFMLGLLPVSYFILIDFNALSIWRENPCIKTLIFSAIFVSYGFTLIRHYVQTEKNSSHYSGA